MADQPTDDLILYEVTDGIARIVINAADQGNSLTADMRDRITGHMEWASADLAVRAVVLSGTGSRHFCTGANLGGPAKPTPALPEGAPERPVGDTARMIRWGWQRLIASILDCDKPVIGAINGTAAGGGAHLVLACDLVVMADNAKLVEVFVKRGIVPDAGGAYLLPRIVGPQITKELMFLGDDCPAERCRELGIANQVVAADELSTVVDALGRPTGGVADQVAPHDQVAGEPVLRVEPPHRLRGRGRRGGDADQHLRLQRGPRRLPGAPQPGLPRLVTTVRTVADAGKSDRPPSPR